jgi:hypothetical protein
MSALMLLFLAVLAAVAVLFCYAAVVDGWRVFHSDSRLRLGEAVRGQGLALPSLDTEHAARAGALAARRCLTCVSQERCDEVLVKREWNALREICPNASYIDGLRRG